jgi:phosphoglucosamine mutase
LVKAEQQHKPVQGVVGTQMSNFGLEEALGRISVPFVRAKVGDRYVLETLLQKGWEIGGENSGHLIHLGKHTTGDAMIACLQVLQYLQQTGSSLVSATADLHLYPQHLINLPLKSDNQNWQTHSVFQNTLKQTQTELGTKGRVLIRPSGTEPLLRIMVEAPEPITAKKMAERLAQALLSKS